MIPLRPAAVGTGLARILGLDSVTHRLRSTVITPLRVAALGDPGVTPPTGLVVYGPDGCGKHHIVTAVAEELELPIVRVAASRLGEEPLAAPSVVLVDSDEDAVDPSVTQDWFDRLDPNAVLTVMVSERPWALAPGLLGAGRFDRMVFVPPPDFAARRRYLLDAVGPTALSADELEDAVALLEGGSGADVRVVVAVAGELAGSAPVRFDHVVAAASGMVPEATRWLGDARCLASMTATRGLVDDLVVYLRRHRLI